MLKLIKNAINVSMQQFFDNALKCWVSSANYCQYQRIKLTYRLQTADDLVTKHAWSYGTLESTDTAKKDFKFEVCC